MIKANILANGIKGKCTGKANFRGLILPATKVPIFVDIKMVLGLIPLKLDVTIEVIGNKGTNTGVDNTTMLIITE